MSRNVYLLLLLIVILLLVTAYGGQPRDHQEKYQGETDCVRASTTACVNAEAATRLFGCGLECQVMCKEAAKLSCERLEY